MDEWVGTGFCIWSHFFPAGMSKVQLTDIEPICEEIPKELRTCSSCT